MLSVFGRAVGAEDSLYDVGCREALNQGGDNNCAAVSLYEFLPDHITLAVLVAALVAYLRNGDTTLKEVSFVALDTREYEPLQAKLEGGN